MKTKLFELSTTNLEEINKLLDDGYILGGTYHNAGTTFIQVYKYTHNQQLVQPPYFGSVPGSF